MLKNHDLREEAVQTQPWDPLSLARDLYSRHARLLRIAGVIAILLFAFWVGMSPHRDYDYPLHVDEWFHIGYTQSMLDEGSLKYANPYGRGVIFYHPEMGFHLLLGPLKATTGLSWMELYRIAPGVLTALLAFLVYALGQREGFGWAAALFVVLIPTSVRTLGPAFLVPVSTAMLSIPVTLLVLHRLEDRGMGRSLWLLLILIGGTIFIHAPTAIIVTALALLYLAAFVIEALASRRYRATRNILVSIVILMLIPAILLGVWLPSATYTALEQSVTGGPSTSEYLGFNTGFFQAFGVIGVALFIYGVFVFTLNRRYGLRTYILPVFVVLFLLFLTFVYPRHLLGPNVLYERGFVYLGLFMAILAGYGAAYYLGSIPALTKRAGDLLSYPLSDRVRVILIAVGLVIIAAAIMTGLVNKERENYAGYYHMVDEQIYADFVWLGQHTTPERKVVMMEPSLAWSYPPIAGPGNRVSFTLSAPRRTPGSDQVHEILKTGDVETTWLRGRNVSVLYTRVPRSKNYTQLKNNDLLEVRPGVYFVPPQ